MKQSNPNRIPWYFSNAAFIFFVVMFFAITITGIVLLILNAPTHHGH